MSAFYSGLLRASLWLLLIVLLSITTGAFAQSASTRVALVSDGPADRDIFSAAVLEHALRNVIAGDRAIVLQSAQRFTGDWTLEGVSAALQRALDDKQIDVVVTLGVLGSDVAARLPRPGKPVIAAMTIDPLLQKFPLVDGVSARRNFTYVADFTRVEDDVAAFHRVIGFKHLVAIADESLLRALPQLDSKVEPLARSLGIRVTLIPTGADAAATLAAIPSDADAVFVGGLLRFDDAQIGAIAQGLIARRLPSFSMVGRSEVAAGLLMTMGGAQRDVERLARRIIVTIQRVTNGEDAANVQVGFATEQRLLINMRTAQAIGFSPRWEDLTDAEQLDGASPADLESISLVAAMQSALTANPALAASRARLDSSKDDIGIARSNLLPSLDAASTTTQLDKDLASIGQPERTSSASLSFQQVLYSERAWANYAISKSLHEASQQGERRDTLDTLHAVATAYLDVLRAKAVEGVRRGNTENTRRNLETARIRETVGLGGRSDRLRWVSQLARDKQQLLSAEATRRQAETELARLMHRPTSAPFATVESGLDAPLEFVATPRFNALLDTPAKWNAFTEFAVDTAVDSSPELAQADAYVTSRQRSLTAAKRAFYVPEVALVSSGSKPYGRDGLGSATTPPGATDESWSVSLQVSIPIFTGRLRSSEFSQARHEVRASEADRADAHDAIEARTRAALHRTAGSYPSIALSAEAQRAADENLAMVTDAYARGAVSITDLIDAQNTALDAGLGAADARYTFLSDFVSVLRSMNDFQLLLDRFSREAWFKRFEDWSAGRTASL